MGTDNATPQPQSPNNLRKTLFQNKTTKCLLEYQQGTVTMIGKQTRIMSMSCLRNSRGGAQADDEISFDPNDIISNIEMVDNDWWAGVLRGVRGMFPANFVQLLDTSVLPPTMDTTTPIEELYDTMYEEEDTYDSMGD